jgi:hypothetical protein
MEAAKNTVPVKVLDVLRQLVGTTERSLRLLIVLLLVCSAILLTEALSVPRLTSSVLLLGSFFAMPSVATVDLVRPEMLLLLPAALALLSVPWRGRVSNLHAILGTAGSMALGALDLQAAITSGALVAISGCVKGRLLDRLSALTSAAAGVALGARVHGTAGRLPEIAFGAPAWEAVQTAVADLWPAAQLSFFVAIFGGCAFPAIALLVRDGSFLQRIALIAGLGIAFWVGTSIVIEGQRSALPAVAPAIPSLVLLWALSAEALGPAPRLAFAAVLAFCSVLPFFRSAPDDRQAILILDQARSIALPDNALAVEGPDRLPIAVYARLGHAPPMPIIYIPEHTPFETLGDVARANGITKVWVHPARDAAPPGFSASESRPAGVRLTPFLLEKP